MTHQGLFIVGCPRSGTTLLQTILASHSALHSAPETSFFSRIIPRLGIEYGDPETIIDRHCTELAAADLRDMTGIELPAGFLEQPADTNVRALFERLMYVFNTDNKPGWVEKTTLHARHLLVITRFYPEARFINLIRDPVACVGSMAAIRPTSWGDFRIRYLGSLHDFATLWESCVAAVFEFPRQERVMHVRYESLVERPQETVSEICDFLGLAYEEAMLASFHNSASGVVSAASCPWQQGNLEPGIRRESLYRWRVRLGPAKTWLIQRYVRRHAMMLGYYEEKARSNAILLVMVFVADQCLRLLTATKIELAVRRLFAGRRT